jgi:hypothetical protein
MTTQAYLYEQDDALKAHGCEDCTDQTARKDLGGSSQ